MWGFSATLRFVASGTDLPSFLLNLKTAFFEAHLLSSWKTWQLCSPKSYKVFIEPSYTIVTPYNSEILGPKSIKIARCGLKSTVTGPCRPKTTPPHSGGAPERVGKTAQRLCLFVSLVLNEFAGIPGFSQKFQWFLGNPYESVGKGIFVTQCLWQGACREMSSLAASAEKREVNADGILLHMLCCACVQPHLLSAICIHLA